MDIKKREEVERLKEKIISSKKGSPYDKDRVLRDLDRRLVVHEKRTQRPR